jgi:transposase
MLGVPRMFRVERRLLIKEGRKSGDPATAVRFLVIAMLAAGRSSVQVSNTLEIARASVSRVAARFVADGVVGLYDRRRSNGDTKVDQRFLRRLAEVLVHTADHFGWARPTWTRELLCRQMQIDGFPRIAVCTMGRALARLGARLGSPKPIVLCPWPRDARLSRLAELRALESRTRASEPVLYSDEVDIHLNPKIGRDWMLRGHQRRILTPGQNEKFYLAGALDVRTGVLHTTGNFHKNAGLFCELLRLLAERYPRARRIHLIVDNYKIHKALETERQLARLGGRVVLHFLPPYCPDSNRIERVWQDLHANVTRNHRCRTLAALLENARRYLVGYVWHRANTTVHQTRAAA